MNVLGWVVVGFIAGALARAATGARHRGCLGTIVVGVLGALLGGAVFRLATGDEIENLGDFDLVSIFVAFVGAAALLMIIEALDRSPRNGDGRGGGRGGRGRGDWRHWS